MNEAILEEKFFIREEELVHVGRLSEHQNKEKNLFLR